MRELRIEMAFVHDGNVNIGDVIKEFRNLYSDVQDRHFKHDYDCKCRFEVSDEVYEDCTSYKIRCPLCNGVIGGTIYEKEENL